MLEFILERYNYWIVIMLMMTGLYIVFSRGNLVKTLIGLNLFQTSVFIFYITIGKIAGGTAPILPYPLPGKGHGDGHGEKDAHAESASYAKDAAHGDNNGDGHESGHGQANDLNEALAGVTSAGEAKGSLHSVPEAAAEQSNDLFAQPTEDVASRGGDEALHSAPEAAEVSHADPAHGGEAAHAADAVAEAIYTNPLPHVLILTAIVVGVATTAVGLALAVRIREAYGTIEEDELEEKDHLAEFGRPLNAPVTQSEAG